MVTARGKLSFAAVQFRVDNFFSDIHSRLLDISWSVLSFWRAWFHFHLFFLFFTLLILSSSEEDFSAHSWLLYTFEVPTVIGFDRLCSFLVCRDCLSSEFGLFLVHTAQEKVDFHDKYKIENTQLSSAQLIYCFYKPLFLHLDDRDVCTASQSRLSFPLARTPPSASYIVWFHTSLFTTRQKMTELSLKKFGLLVQRAALSP